MNMDIETRINGHVLKEPNTIQSTPIYKQFREKEQFYDDVHNALYKSPKNKYNKKVTPQSEQSKVKRNLNDSFSETPKSNNKDSPHLHYSLVSENESDAALVLRLRLSKTQPYYVDSTQGNEKIIGARDKKTRRISFADERLPLKTSAKAIKSTRRSSHAVGRTSYAKLLSPEKNQYEFLDEKDENESWSIKDRNDTQSPRKRIRSKSVDSNQNDHSYQTKTDIYAVPSPKKRGRPRRASVSQQSYKEEFTDDDQDLFGSDSPFPSPVKRTRSKRIVKIPARYTELSDIEIIDGVQELAMSDDEFEVVITSSSSKKGKHLVENKSQRKSDPEPIQDEPQKNSRKNYVAEPWKTPCKTPRSSSKKSSIKLQSPAPCDSSLVDEICIPDFSPVPLDRWRFINHTPTTPRSSTRKPNKADSRILHDSPPMTKTRKESTRVPKTPKTPRLEKTPPNQRHIQVACPVLHDSTSSTKKRQETTLADTHSHKLVSTPKSSLKLSPKKTAANSLKLMRAGVLTPTVQSRVSAVKGTLTPLNKARIALHVAHVPDALPCREREAADIFGFVEGKLIDGCGGCIYISGVPGTGKTATVTYVIRQLQMQSQNRNLPEFEYVSINGMRLTEPRQSYVEILKQLTGKTVQWEQAYNQLNLKFTKKGRGSKPIVLLVDELDILCTKRQDVVYSLLDWPSKAYCQLIVVTIANTMDLPERLLMGRVTSRLGLTRLTFQPYNYSQLQEIVTKRLLDSNTFNPDAIQLVARKVASVSGDARRALDICRRAAEMTEADHKNTLVSMTHVNEALESMMTQPKIRAIKSSSRLQKLLLQSVVAEVERTGVEETTFSAVFRIFSSVAAIDGFAMVSMTIAMAAVAKLGSCRLLLLDQKISGLYQRIMLNVSVDDVYYALKSE